MNYYASLKSIGAYVPEKILSNEDLEKMVDTSDEWIMQRTGIKQRRIAKDDEFTSDMGVKAAQIALQRAKLKAEDVDAVICATLSPDYLTMPSTAAVISDMLGIHGKVAFDISAACSGFVYMLNIAKSFVESGTYKNVLIIGAEKLSSFVDWNDRTTCILFGDGAGAALIAQTHEKKHSILDIKLGSDGAYSHLLMTSGGGSRLPNAKQEQNANFISMSGNEVFKIAVKTLSKSAVDILEQNGITSDKIDHFIPHQANLRIIEAVRKKLNFPLEKTILNVERYGNTSAASIPLAINEAYEKSLLKPGDLMLLDTFGGGFTWGSALVHFGKA